MAAVVDLTKARNIPQSRQGDSSAVLQDFISRARTMEHLEEYAKLQKFAEAKAQDKTIMIKHREIRKKKEEISRNKGIRPLERKVEKMPKEDYIVDEENDTDVFKQLNEFEIEKIGNDDSDSD
ncbi:uncharacterized protein LOC123529052 isoform X2 [Mercenaria mercenaria]|uniref:uncharacterized protein LOC123529052 isoform X2 n=1 Tax=Mercenaria mercenaria TaxID=6596 RepID=UPI00234F1AC7|nr:uncharacterized protein LOC123529052 isoform X2 [Mercenaria mercenaria]